ncbi:hypothetical protein D6D15_09887 [Aureobasidium pullulans]|uniref:Uncharacterized protein n=1 Tax=Aureobasidium pullulans TaxID=5580 RepID=A0A4S9ASP6_AURPU|nr:hypothetical protein D6D15_09887 [Aureobasidium pullulans]
MEIVSPLCSWQEHLESVYTHQKSEGQIVPLRDISKDLFEDAIGPEEAATKIASFVCASDDFQTAYLEVIYFVIGAANNLSEQHDLYKLANLTLALSRLPDARNPTRTTIQLSFDYKSSEIGPGDIFMVGEGKIWAGLPQFAVNLGDSMYGPTAYISDGLAEHWAEQKWTNLNTFAAYLISGSDNTPCPFDYLYLYTFRTITDSLEYDPKTEKGIDSLHSLRSACRWITIAGEQIWTESMRSPRNAAAGPLWHRKYHADLVKSGQWEERSLVTSPRWLAWASRLDELAGSGMIEDELNDMARSCAEMIRMFEREWVFDIEDEIQ